MNYCKYLCKAKCKNWQEKPIDEQWVYGYFVRGLDIYEKPLYLIFEPTSVFYKSGETDGFIVIDETTLCRHTGLTDIKGKYIWENDIVKEHCNGLISKVIWDEKTATFKLEDLSNDYKIEDSNIEWEVLGNIFDNEEILNRKDV